VICFKIIFSFAFIRTVTAEIHQFKFFDYLLSLITDDQIFQL